MAKRIAPILYTQRGLNRVRQTISIEKLNIIRNMIRDRNSIKQIQRAIGMKKTAANKWVRLVEIKIQKDIFAGVENSKEEITPILYHGQPQQHFNQATLNEIHIILTEDRSLNSKEIYQKLNLRGHTIIKRRTQEALA